MCPWGTLSVYRKALYIRSRHIMLDLKPEPCIAHLERVKEQLPLKSLRAKGLSGVAESWFNGVQELYALSWVLLLSYKLV